MKKGEMDNRIAIAIVVIKYSKGFFLARKNNGT